MRYFLSIAFLLLATGFGAAVPHVRAQADCTDLSGDALTNCINNQLDSQSTPDNTTGEQLTAEIQQAANQTPSPPPTASFDTGGVLGQVMSWIASLFAWLLGVAIVALNTSVYFTVVTMGNYVHGLNAVGVSWRILRDVGNIMLIFGFLAAGLMVIIGLEDTSYGWGRKMIPKLLIAAVLLNFSLFFAEAIIDTGNLFATQFYAQISGGQIPAPGTLSNTGIADKIMQQLGLTQMYNGVKTNPQLLGKSPLFVGFMGILLFLVTAFVMFSLAFMFVARFVVLIILIVVAPVGFAGWAVPKLENISRKWWSNLLEQTMTAPVLLLLLYVALAVITDKNFLSFGPSPNWNGIFAGDSTSLLGYASVLLSFLVAMGLLLVVLMVAKSMSAVGASWATKTAGSLTFGSVAFAGRYTGGWLGNKAAQRLRRSSISRVPLLGSTLVRSADKIAGASFDVRGSKTATGALKTLGSATGSSIDVGQPQKGGYAAALKAGVESRTKYAEGLKGTITPEEEARLKTLRQQAAGVQATLAQKREEQKKNPNNNRLMNEVAAHEAALQNFQRDIGTLEAKTDKSAKLSYASNLTLGGLNLLTANREAAKKIKDAAKKSDDEKALENFKKALRQMGKEEVPPEQKPGTAQAGGTAPEGTAPSGGDAH